MTGCGLWFITGLIVGSPPRSIWTSLPPVSSGAADRFITLLEWARIYCTSADVPLTWDLPACEMSRMAHGGFGLEVDPHVVMEESRQALSSVELDQPDEVDWTQVWRHEQLLALGFDVVRASLMADDAGVDLAQARKLVALGCPLETASRILL